MTRSSASRSVPNMLSNEESPMVNDVPYAVKDTDGDSPIINSSATLRYCVKSTGNDVYCCEAPRMASRASASPTGSARTGPFSGNDDEGKNNDDIRNDDLWDVCIIIEKGRNGHTSVSTTVINACGLSAKGSVTHRVSNTHSSKRDTEQHHDAFDVDNFTGVYIVAEDKNGDVIMAFPITTADSVDNYVFDKLPNAPPTTPGGPSPRRLSLPSVLMRYHPIDRGRRHVMPI